MFASSMLQNVVEKLILGGKQMKKTKMLVATLVCAVLLMGVGYAWWTDSISINGTVATGNMDVIWENCEPLLPLVLTGPYIKTDVDASEDAINFTFSNLYPGGFANIDCVAKNNSSIPVKVQRARIDVNADQELLPYLEVAVLFHKLNKNGWPVLGSYGVTDFVPIDKLADVLNSSSLKGMTLNPGERIVFGVPEGEESPYDLDGDGIGEECFLFRVKSSASNGTMDKDVNFTLYLDFQQVNQQ